MPDDKPQAIETLDQAQKAGIGNVFSAAPGMTGGAPQPGGQDPRAQEAIVQLLQRAAKPRMEGPQVAPEVMKAAQPQPTPQKLTGTLFGLIMDHAQRAKSLQLAHASQKIKALSDAITDAYEHATSPDGQVNEAQAKHEFMNSWAVKSLMSKEGQKDMKQMEKLLQMDFVNPEKKRTVWHEALENVAKLTGAERAMKGIKELFGKHKDAMQEQLQKQGQAQQQQQQGRQFAEGYFGAARQGPPPELKEIAPMVAAMDRTQAAAAMLQQKEEFADYERQQKEKFASSVDSIKDPNMKMLARSFQARLNGDTASADKFMDLANKGFAAKKGPVNTLTGWINKLSTGTPEEQEVARTELAKYMDIQMTLLKNRGMAFGMGRLAQYTDDDGVMGPKGATVILNGFQLDDQMRGTGGHFTQVGTIQPQIMLGVQQLVGQNKGVFDELEKNMDVWDNESDRNIFSRVMRVIPGAALADESTLGTWLDQNLKSQLSPKGQEYLRQVLIAAEVLGTSRRLTGQNATGMTTQLITAMLPSESTPSSAYGRAQLKALRNYLDGLVQAPILGQVTGKAKADAAKPLSDEEIGNLVDDVLGTKKKAAGKP